MNGNSSPLNRDSLAMNRDSTLLNPDSSPVNRDLLASARVAGALCALAAVAIFIENRMALRLTSVWGGE